MARAVRRQRYYQEQMRPRRPRLRREVVWVGTRRGSESRGWKVTILKEAVAVALGYMYVRLVIGFMNAFCTIDKVNARRGGMGTGMFARTKQEWRYCSLLLCRDDT